MIHKGFTFSFFFGKFCSSFVGGKKEVMSNAIMYNGYNGKNRGILDPLLNIIYEN